MSFFTFRPLYQERIWGGRNLASKLGRKLPEGKVIGESWEIVDRAEAMSVTTEGSSLRELIEADPERIMGLGWAADQPFPILVKWLDCQKTLSLQVHPPKSAADDLGGQPKTENWYIADAEPRASIIAGLKRGVTRKSFEAALNEDALESLVHTIPSHTGDSIFIQSGRLHAIGGGNLILEIQQNSDTTYRVYDWGRVGLDGKPRRLHIEESLASTDFEDFEPTAIHTGKNSQVLAQSDVFDLKKLSLKNGETVEFAQGQPRILSLVSGELLCTDGRHLKHSQNALLPAAEDFSFKALSPCEVLVTENFNRNGGEAV